MRDFSNHPGRSAVYARKRDLRHVAYRSPRRPPSRPLQAGGNAVDAANRRARFCSACANRRFLTPGIGGDCFVLVKPAGSEEIVALNGSGRGACRPVGRPRCGNAGHKTMPVFGDPAAVTIPGRGRCLLPALGRLRQARPRRRARAPRSTTPSRRSGRAARAVRLTPPSPPTPLSPRARRHLPDRRCRAARRPAVPPPRPGRGAASASRATGRKGRSYEGEVAEEHGSRRCARSAAFTRLRISPPPTCDYTTPISGSYKGVEPGRASAERPGRDGDLAQQHPAEFDIPSMDPWGTERAHI